MIRRMIYLFAAVCLAACGDPGLNVMTFNVRYDNPDDAQNNWRFRREQVAEVVTSQGIDVFGAQEVLANQMDDLRQLLQGYEAVGVGRADGACSGEYNPVFFLRDRFTLLDSGTFWLSETPETAGSKGWDGACERIATWVVLRDAAGREFLFVNTHLDHVGQVARDEGVALLRKRIEMLRAGRPVILTGDFNADSQSTVIAAVQRQDALRHAKDVAATCNGPSWSFSNFGRIPESDRQLIDYIFVSDGFAVDRYEVLPDLSAGVYVSDHAPVMTVIRFAE